MAFNLILTVASRLVHPYCTDDKTSRLVENLFTVNIDVLSSVLYGWGSLEATVRIRLKARGRRLKSKT